MSSCWVYLSVCPFVRPSRSCILSKRIIIFSIPYGESPSEYWRGLPLKGASNARGMKKWRFSTNISFYLRNYTRYGHSYYERRIGNRTQAFEWCHFQWSWTTANPEFKVSPLFNAENLRKGTRYRNSYNEILIGIYALLKNVISNDNDWPWVA